MPITDTPLLDATIAQAGVMARIHAACFPPPDRWNAEAMAALLGLPGVFCLLDPAGALIMARLAADECEILTLAVAPDARRRGVARRLLRVAETGAASFGAITMFLEVAEDNVAARGLYDACGYGIVGRRTRYYPSGGDALLLRAPLIRDAATPG